MASGYTPSWFYGMSQEFSISRNHPYTTGKITPIGYGAVARSPEINGTWMKYF
jgi:hypothetical protein